MDVGGEIRLGSMLFTLVEPHRGHEVAYNRWYERDHFNAGCMVGPWLYAGRRWVATRDLKALRIGDGTAALGTYLAVYFIIDGKHDEHVDWALRQVKWLHANGRMFAERDHIHTLLYRYLGIAGDDDGVPAELVLDHPYGGLFASVVERPAGVAGSDLLAAVQRSAVARPTLAFEPIPLPDDAPVSQPGLSNLAQRTLLLTFLAGRPDDEWRAHVTTLDGLAAAGAGTAVWAAPFVPTIPGTDRYTDELW